VGIKLYNKLPNKIKKLEKIRELKKRLKNFLLQHIFYSVDEYMSYQVLLSVIYSYAQFYYLNTVVVF
jgi:hypothetical protein